MNNLQECASKYDANSIIPEGQQATVQINQLLYNLSIWLFGHHS